jgi:hypothetical protein
MGGIGKFEQFSYFIGTRSLPPACSIMFPVARFSELLNISVAMSKQVYLNKQLAKMCQVSP